MLVNKSPLQDFVLGVGAQLGRDQKSTCKFSTGTHHTHPGLEAARRIINKVHKLKGFKLKFCKSNKTFAEVRYKTSEAGSFKNEPEVSREKEVSRVCVQRNFSPCANSGHNKLKPNVCRARTLE